MMMRIHVLAVALVATTVGRFSGRAAAFVPTTMTMTMRTGAWPSASTMTPKPKPRGAPRWTTPKRPRRSGRGRDRPDRPAPRDTKFEYLMDADARRQADSFHLLLMSATFNKPRMSVAYAAGALCLVLSMPESVAIEKSEFAKKNFCSCLGAWEHDECLKYAEQLDGRDVICRVVPAVRGRSFWQGDKANEPAGIEGAP